MRSKYLIAIGILVLGVIVIVWKLSSRRSGETIKEQLIATLEGKFHCTFYYTPRESGFLAEHGFDLTPETRPGLKGQKFARDFLLAVEKEGFGRLKNPFGGKQYLRYWSGTWGFAEQPVDSKQRPLVPRRSSAVSKRQSILTDNVKLTLKSSNLSPDLASAKWNVVDTGSGLDEWQIDLYWGEDDPLGPGRKISRPKSAPSDLLEATILVWQ